MARRSIEQRIEAFGSWLTAHGAELLKTTNKWELVRFRSGEGVGIIYTNAGGRWTFQGPAQPAWSAYLAGEPWESGTPRRKRRKSDVLLHSLIQRDGDGCFYCGEPLGDDATDEHLLAIIHGGSNHIANRALAHKLCNSRAGHLSVAEKVKLRDTMRADIAAAKARVAA